jgi:hypothetical protein
MRRLVVAVVCLLAGCEAEEASQLPDSAVDFDASPDAAAADGAVPDAASTDPDAAGGRDAAPDPDAAGGRDAAPDVDAADLRDAAAEPDAGTEWGPCQVDDTTGECLDVAECTGDREPVPGHCPGPAAIQCCIPRDAAFACDANDHPQPNVGLTEEPGEGGCPPGMLPVADFCVDRFEAALVEVTPEGERPWSPYHNPEDRRVRAVSLRGAVPQGYVSGAQAGRACAEAGKRLCTDAEWLRACQGPDALTYPYGDRREDGVCNDHRARHPAVELFPDDPTPFDRIQDACINQLPDSLATTGSHPGCVTAEGALDMMGNLHEWTADPAGTFRGGFYVDTRINGNGCLYRTTAHDTSHWDYSTGFRCCADR